MPKVYISTIEEKGIIKYALYDECKKPAKILRENWEPLIYDTESEAMSKLALLEAEKQREEEAVAFSLEEAETFTEKYQWKFATTYAKTAPHEYLVKKWLDKDDQLMYERFVATMKLHSVVGYFYGHANNYFILGNHYYWFMPLPDNLAVDLINRTTTDYLEFRDGAYYYLPR